MTPARWQQVKATLAEALERPAESERAAFLARACAGDTSLRREVESLLDQPPDDFDSCAESAGLVNSEPLFSANHGRRVGAYELVRELGRGGMGTVWLGKRADQQFEKLVAVKLLKRGTDTDEVLGRFRAERQILARLEHPNIARLLDAGMTEDGLPYFVMEFVEGMRLTDFVVERQLPLTECVELFLKICGAVQFAHQNLIVHRDLKPGNILVTPEGEPKLLDFGIAKLLAGDEGSWEVTMAGAERLTPGYASPEQVRGETVTTVSDIYSLGALLYEVLAGRPPHEFPSALPTPTQILRVVCEEEPARPSAVARPERGRELRGDLDTIVLRALRKRRSGATAVPVTSPTISAAIWGAGRSGRDRTPSVIAQENSSAATKWGQPRRSPAPFPARRRHRHGAPGADCKPGARGRSVASMTSARSRTHSCSNFTT